MFTIFKKDGGYLPALEKYPTKALETYQLGELLILSGGGLTKCGATASPQFVCQENYTASAGGGKDIAVMPIDRNITYSTTASAALPGSGDTAVSVGDKVTLSSDAMEVTATKTSGVALVVYKGGEAKGDEVHVKFI